MAELAYVDVASEYATRMSSIGWSLRSEAESVAASIREIAKVFRWLEFAQPTNAVCPPAGITSDIAYQFKVLAYQLRVSPHTATGRPAIQLVMLPDRQLQDHPDHSDEVLFRAIVDRISRGNVLADWEGPGYYSVAVNLRVHPSLVKSATSNQRRRGADPGALVVPPGWHP